MLIKKYRQILGISFLIFFLFGCQKQVENGKNICNILSLIPDGERAEIESFFAFLVCNNECAYTLFGNKPATVVDVSLDFLSMWYLCHPDEYIALEKGWLAWEKYSSLFSSDFFVIKENKSSTTRQLFFINKKSTLCAIREHITTFEDILGASIQPEKLLEELCHPQISCMATLKDSPILLGILLGYGEHNSRFFAKRSQLCMILHKKMNLPYFNYAQDVLSAKSLFLVNLKWRDDPSDCTLSSCRSLAEDLNHIVANEEECELEYGHYFLDRFLSPVFIADRSHPETEELRKEYIDTREKIYQAYSQGRFLEVTLQQWMHPK